MLDACLLGCAIDRSVQAMSDDGSLTASELTELEAIADQTKRGLLLIAMLSARLQNPSPVVVGDFALEFYSTGGYSTADIDLVYIDPARIGRMLESADFQKVGRHWVSERFDLQIEIPSLAMERQEYGRVVEVTIAGRTVQLIGIEDLILDRLGAAVHGGSTDDLHWAVELLTLYQGIEGFDITYIEERARDERLSEVLHDVRERAEGTASD